MSENGDCIYREAVKEKLSPMLNDPDAIDFWEWQCSEIDDIPAADVRPKWISVEERLPEHCQDVLVALRRVEIAVDYYQPNRWGYRDVTHWMPLPEPPKEET